MTREDDGPTLRVELRPHAQAHLVSLPAKQLRVYRPHEGVHAIEAFWCRAGRQPFEIAVRTRDVSVRAGCDVDDDFSTLRHEYRSPLARGAGSELISSVPPSWLTCRCKRFVVWVAVLFESQRFAC